MAELERIEIWSKDTLILDLPGDVDALQVPAMRPLEVEWAARRQELGDSDALRLFYAQFSREWSIETGQIEGLYSLNRGVTQTLIEEGLSKDILERELVPEPHEIIELLKDQQHALEVVFSFVKNERELTTGFIKELHAAMTRSQETVEAHDPSGRILRIPMIHGDWKQSPNSPRRDEKLYIYCPPEHVASEMERLVDMHSEHLRMDVPYEVEAAWLHHRFTQIHPFQDGNGRVARALASSVFLRKGLFPFIVDRDEKDSYLLALETADRGDLKPLVFYMAQRQRRAVDQALSFIARSAPAPSNPRDAATRLAKTWHTTVEAGEPKFEAAQNMLASIVHKEANQAINAILPTLQRSRPKLSLEVLDRLRTPLPEAVRDNVSFVFGRSAKEPAICSTFRLVPSDDVLLQFYTFIDQFDIEPQAHAIAILNVRDVYEAATDQSISAMSGEDVNNVRARCEPWVSKALTSFLNLLADGNA